ncbi:hypothetical protein PAPYR_13354 [Paratrimastix pyriformis]|uniref:Uncharacterized protein n=1 Tax=Paratrimastix pyriformis TaxID=342808 RepID=A0ABQ8U5B7_9EUKA|nr:hypothetical protein PAPYR_13354 [Paratrimastix pyriformis]
MESEKRRWTSLLSLDVAAAALRHRGTTSRPLMMRLDRGDVVVCGDPCCAYSPLSWLAAIGMGRYGAQFLARSYDWHARSAADIVGTLGAPRADKAFLLAELELLQQRAARAHAGRHPAGGRSAPVHGPHRAPANAALKAEEDRLRGLFVSARDHPDLADPHALLVPLYPPGCKPHQVEVDYPLLPPCLSTPRPIQPRRSTVSLLGRRPAAAAAPKADPAGPVPCGIATTSDIIPVEAGRGMEGPVPLWDSHVTSDIIPVEAGGSVPGSALTYDHEDGSEGRWWGGAGERGAPPWRAELVAIDPV